MIFLLTSQEPHLQEALASQEEAALDSGRYDQLDKLLNQTGMYTTFLSEQLQQMDAQMFEDTEVEVGQKRKAGKQGGRGRKKGAAAKTTAGSKKVTGDIRQVEATCFSGTMPFFHVLLAESPCSRAQGFIWILGYQRISELPASQWVMCAWRRAASQDRFQITVTSALTCI